MATISENLSTLNNIKNDIKKAINDKGGTAGDNMNEYAGAISALPSGGGELPAEIYLQFANSTANIIPMSLLSNINKSNMDNLFKNCSYLTSLDLNNITQITSGNSTFYNTGKSASVFELNLQNVNSISYAYETFRYCGVSQLVLPELTNLSDTNYFATDMTNCQRIEFPKLNKWKGSGATGIKFSFATLPNCTSISMPLLTNISSPSITPDPFTSSVPKLNTINFGSLQYLSATTFSKGISLSRATQLTSLYIGQIQNSANPINNLSYCTKLSHESLLNVINALRDGGATYGSSVYTIGATNLAKLSADEIAIATDKGWTLN